MSAADGQSAAEGRSAADGGFAPSDGARLWTTASGDGPDLVLLNGGPGCSDYLGPVASLLEDACRVIRFEPRGCGRSDWDGNYELDVTLADVEAIRRHHGVERWVVVGHSAGADFALAYALRHPDRTLGVVGLAGGRLVNDRDWSRVYHERLAAGGEPGGVEFHADPEVNALGVRSWREFIQRPSLFREVADLDLPCVFIAAGDDIRPSWPTRQLAALLPRARYREIEGASHYPWLTHADALRRELHDALRYVLGMS